MKAKEFRIGNVVLDKFGKTIIIESINESGINLRFGDGNGVYPDFEFEEIFKIPLTEEILLKCVTKFKGINHRSEIWIQGECFEFFVNENDFHLQFTGGEGVSFSVPIKYLHSLQNIFHALTNEELIINL